MLQPPDYKNRTPSKIIDENIYFDSVGYIYRSLSWLELAKVNRNTCALFYAALECRLGIEQLLFEELVLSMGTKLDEAEYEKCKGNSTKLYKIIERLNPDYKKLAEFTKAVMSVNPQIPPLEIWDHHKLIKHWRMVSDYLHLTGAPKDTFRSEKWIKKAIDTIQNACEYIWNKKKSGFTAILRPEKMQDEIYSTWLKYKDGKIDLNAVKRISDLTLPILSKRTKA
ncbi:hypothetical protein JW935_06640 [candidate division KSB1 bacterium]|nr:hypothetical protein [candidate division KSB1 bacterium]